MSKVSAGSGSDSPAVFVELVTGLVNGPQRSRNSYRRFAALSVSALSLSIFFQATSSPAFAATTVDLGSANSYAVLAGTTVTNTGSSVIKGDVGLSPGTSVTGFPPGNVSGTINAANASSLAAQTSDVAAYGVVMNATPANTVASGTLGGTTLLPGDYHNSTLSLNGTMTLNGNDDPNSIFIFQSDSTLVTGSSSKVLLENGAQACNVYWQVGSSATLGTTTDFSGTILALTSATLNTGASVNGRILAQTGAVTLDSNNITVPTCAASSTSATTTTTSGTTATTSGTTAINTGSNTTIPVGAPGTGKGGTAGPSKFQLGLIGLAALLGAFGAGAFAIKTRRQNG